MADDPLAGKEVLNARMKNAQIQLVAAMRGIKDASIEIRSQEYVTEADALLLIVDDLIVQYNALVVALTT